MVKKFTNILYDLVVKKELSLKESLEIMSNNNSTTGKKIRSTASYLYNCIMHGESFSNSLKKNCFIEFDDIYITFITYGENTGNLNDTIIFLNNRCNRKEENISRMIEAAIYPCFVIILALCAVFYFSRSKLFSLDKEIFYFTGLLILISFLIFFFIKKCIGENKLYEAFLGIGFLIKAGINLYDAVCLGARIVGISTKKGLLFLTAGEKLLFGMDLQQSFSFEKKYSNAFYYAGKSGGNADIFEKIANWIGEEDEKKRKLCFSLIEPVFIMITGLFLLILVSNLFIPYLSDFSWI